MRTFRRFPAACRGRRAPSPDPARQEYRSARVPTWHSYTHIHTYGSEGDRAPARASCGTVQCAAIHPFRKRATLRPPPSRALDHVQVRRPLPVSRSHATAVLSAERGEHPSCACPCFFRLFQCFCVCTRAAHDRSHRAFSPFVTSDTIADRPPPAAPQCQWVLLADEVIRSYVCACTVIARTGPSPHSLASFPRAMLQSRTLEVSPTAVQAGRVLCALARRAPAPGPCVRFVNRESYFLAPIPLIPVAARNGNASAVPAAPDDPLVPRPRPHDQYQYRERTPRTPRTPPVRTLAVMRADPGALCPLLYTPSRGPLCSGTGAHSLGSARPGLGRFSPSPHTPSR